MATKTARTRTKPPAAPMMTCDDCSTEMTEAAYAAAYGLCEPCQIERAGDDLEMACDAIFTNGSLDVIRKATSALRRLNK